MLETVFIFITSITGLIVAVLAYFSYLIISIIIMNLDQYIQIIRNTWALKIIGSIIIYFIYIFLCIWINRKKKNYVSWGFILFFIISIIWTLIIVIESFWIFSIIIILIIFYIFCWEMSKYRLILNQFNVPQQFKEQFIGLNEDTIPLIISSEIKNMILYIKNIEKENETDNFFSNEIEIEDDKKNKSIFYKLGKVLFQTRIQAQSATKLSYTFSGVR